MGFLVKRQLTPFFAMPGLQVVESLRCLFSLIEVTDYPARQNKLTGLFGMRHDDT